MAVHLHTYSAENLRGGQATKFSRNPVVPVPRLNGGGPDRYASFDKLERTTLIGSALTHSGHRDSIDRMAAWLGRNHGHEVYCGSELGQRAPLSRDVAADL